LHPGARVEVFRKTGQTKEEFTMMAWYGGGMGLLGWLAMGLFWLLLLGLIVWLVVRLLPGSGGGTTRDVGESALEILDRRLASGEIDLEAWKAHRAALVAAQSERS
jgi:putative membrane protein